MKKFTSYLLPIVILIAAYVVLMDPFAPNDIAPTTSIDGSNTYGKPLIGGDFSLVDVDGNMRRDAEFRGTFMIVYFGFTNCPHICPTALLRVTNALEALPKDVASRIQPLFITVDPERDTSQRIKEYLQDYHDSIIGLTGSEEALAEVKSAYKAYAAKEEVPADGNYNVGHSSFIYVMNKEGEYLKHFPHNVKDAELSAYLIEVVQ